MIKLIVPFLGVLAIARGETTSVSACVTQGNANNLPINTYVLGCPTPPCTFAQGTDVVLQVVFRSPRRITSMRTEAWAFILGPIGINYDLGAEANTCNFFTNTYCPLQEDEVVMYMLRMHIESWMPAGTAVTVEFLIRDTSNNSVVTCVRVPVRITAGTRDQTLLEHSTPDTHSSISQDEPVAL